MNKLLPKIFILFIVSVFIYSGLNVYRNTTVPSPQKAIVTKTQPTPTAKLLSSPRGRVLKVIDGDTIRVSIDGTVTVVRVIGIDTPETVDPRKPVQCFGVQASDRAKKLLMDKIVQLEPDPTQDNKDKYGRLLRFVFVEGQDYGLSTIRDGYAHEYTYTVAYKYQQLYKTAEKQARENKKGLWSETACTNPT